MTPGNYKSERMRRGTQQSVSALLQVSRGTIARRETGAMVITREAELAMLALPKLDHKGRETKPLPRKEKKS